MRALLLVATLIFLPLTAAAQEPGHEVADAHSGDPAAPGDDHGGDAHGAVHLSDVLTGEEAKMFWGALLNFALLIGVFYWLGRKPLKGFLASRRKGVEEGLAEAQRLTAAAEAKHKEYSERLDQLDRELENIRADMVKAGQAERDRIVAEAEAKAARLRRETDFLIEQQMKQLRVDLTRETVEAAVAAAESVLRENTNPADQERLAKSYLERLQEEARKEQRA